MAHNRRPVTRPPSSGSLQAEFNKHTESVYGGMRARFGARKNDQGEITRAARPLPFTLGEFRAWLLAGPFRGSCDNAVQCRYCRAWLNAITFVPDHREPVKYGGSLGLENIDLVCDACNLSKGVLSSAAFQSLIDLSLTFHPQDSADLFGRLKNGAGYLRLQIQARGIRKKAAAASLHY